MFDIKNPNSFLGGQNVHNLIIIGLLIYIIFKLMKNNSESSYKEECPAHLAPCEDVKEISWGNKKATS